MKVLISADMEGTCGVVSWVQVMPPEYGGEPHSQDRYYRPRERMTAEINAAHDAIERHSWRKTR